MAFDFKRHLIKVQGGRTYLPVSARIVWFREQHPDWGIITEAMEINHEKQYAVFRATVFNAEGKIMATGTKKEDVKGFGDYLEKAECVPLDTQILTAEGWKTHDELRLGEPVLAYDVRTECMGWVPLLAVRRYSDAPVVRASNGKGFDVVCTPDHKWAVRYDVKCNGKKYTDRKLRETTRLTKADAITVGAVAPGGLMEVTPQQAFIMGLLITDGCVRYNGKHIRAYICQAKPDGVGIIRERLRGVPHTESTTPAHTRTGPTGETSDCRGGYRWNIAASYLHEMHDAFGIVHETELPNVIAGLSKEARGAMLEAMMLAEGDKRGDFAQMPGRNDWVIDTWTALCALEGSMVYRATLRKSCGGIWTARRKKSPRVWASNIVVEDVGVADVWCPQTPFGTWVARFSNDVVTVTGNTGAVGRALALCGFGTQFSPELDETGGGRLADSPQPMGGGRYGGGNSGGGNYGGNRYGNSGGTYGGSAPTGNSGGDGNRFTPPREGSPPASNRGDGPARPDNAFRSDDSPPRSAAPPPAPRPAPAPALTEEEDDDFEALVGVGGLTNEDDPFGAESEAAAPSKATAGTPGAGRAEAKTDGPPACGGCGKALTKAQNDLSIRNYGEALCPNCQREKPRTGRTAVAER